jgi:predicted metal-dependent enzyme (double-stranded beta helix superfamily)
MFDPDRLIETCRDALPEGQRALREALAASLSDAASVAARLGGAGPGLHVLHRSGDLTVLNFIWAPSMSLPPHNHQMAAVIGVYAGREDNIFWRRRTTESGSTIEAAGAQSLGPGDIATLGRDVIHSVTNPLAAQTGAVHVYAGDFFAPPVPRSEWDHATLAERPWDVERSRAAFADAARRASTA